VKFWDASAIVPLCLTQPGTLSLRRIARGDGSLIAWWGTPVECYSAFARLRRDEVLSPNGEGYARAVLNRLTEEWTEIEPSREVRANAGRVLLLHPLRAAEALQLAAALVWARGRPVGYEFVCLDERLRDAAGREGFAILP
jgi:predicted nucleic acid-binding protein